jgi:hypothetical protein
MFDINGREGMNIPIARFFLACENTFNIVCSQCYDKIIYAIDGGPVNTRNLVMRSLIQSWLTKRNLTLGRLWNHEIFMEYRWFQS